MNTKTIISFLMIATIAGNVAIAREWHEYSDEEKAEIRRQGEEERKKREAEAQDRFTRRAHGLPSNPNETPSSPKTIYHHKKGEQVNPIKGRPRKMEEARIFFDVDESGKPSYRSIAEHFEKNPKFKEVGLVIYHPGWFSESFEHIGKVGDEDAYEKMADTISDEEGYLLWKRKKNGAWCPLANVFIGGNGDIGQIDRNGKQMRNICEDYEKFLAARDQK